MLLSKLQNCNILNTTIIDGLTKSDKDLQNPDDLQMNKTHFEGECCNWTFRLHKTGCEVAVQLIQHPILLSEIT